MTAGPYLLPGGAPYGTPGGAPYGAPMGGAFGLAISSDGKVLFPARLDGRACVVLATPAIQSPPRDRRTRR
jgi:hypothetical protein